MLLSIIVPVYDGERYIEDTVENILGQTFTDYELILVNDGSKDASLSIMRKLSIKDRRIRIFTKENEGICATRNFGISRANGEFIVFLDQDDSFDSGLCGDYVETMMKTGADMCVFGHSYTLTKPDGSKRHLKIQPTTETVLGNKKQIYEHIFNVGNDKTFLTVWNCIYKKEIIRRHGILFPTDFRAGYEDTVFNMLYASKCKSVFLCPRIHYSYQRREGISTITKANDNVLDDFRHMADTAYALVAGLSADYQNAYRFFVLRLLQVPYFRTLSHKGRFTLKEKMELTKRICRDSRARDAAACSMASYKVCPLYKAILYAVRFGIRHERFFVTMVALDIIRFRKEKI